MHKLENSTDLDPLISAMANKQVVMLGEASHGTHEYYTWRTAISKRLIREHGFQFVAVEGDWPDCYKLNRYIKGYADAGDHVEDVLKSFDRWPTWMWANWEVAALAEWLKEHNVHQPVNKKAGFYGLDVYSLWDSMKAMMEYLQNEDPSLAAYAQQAWRCFDPFHEDEQQYARHTLYNARCKDEVVGLLKQIRMRAQFMDGDREAGLNTEQNAIIAVNAENYYSAMVRFDNESWNIRDRHMIDTLDRLLNFHGPQAKAIVWEHNTHIGDARATDMAKAGMVNTGQLAREKYGEENVFLCGFAGYEGTVIAGEQWGAPMEVMEVPKARSHSIESLLHKKYNRDCYSIFVDETEDMFNQTIPHRAIGVVYDPEMEHYGNYVPSFMSQRYDALLFFNQTKALHPMKLYTDTSKVDETYPFAF